MALTSAGLLLGACSKDDNGGSSLPEPNFPAKTTLGIEVGGTCTIPISPNQAWSVSIDRTQAGEWFWLDDDGMPAYTVRGKAGEHEIVICVSDVEEHDTDRSIDITMTMGSESQVIATVTRGTVERQFDLYLGEESGFGEVTYEEEPIDAVQTMLTIPWKETSMEPERRPIKIAANFQWRIDSKPEWLAELSPSEGKPGETVEILLSGNPTAYPLEDTESELIFCDYNNNEIKYSFRIAIPGCKNKESITINQGTIYTFNAVGEYGKGGIGSTSWTLYGTTFQAMAPMITTNEGAIGYKIFALDKKEVFEGAFLYSVCNWVQVHENVLSGNNVLVNTEYRLTTEANTGSRATARTASVVLLPAELAKDITSANDLIEPDPNTYMPSLKEEYRPYELATINQDAPISDLFSVRDLKGMQDSNTTFRQLTFAQDGQLPENMASIFGTPNEQNYLMTYTSENSNASVIYDKSLTGFTVKFFDEMFMPMESGESSWLNIRKDEAFEDSEGNAVTAQSFDILMENVSEDKTGYIVFYSGNTPKAAICCKTDSGSGADAFQAEITSNSPNSYLEPITIDNYAEMASMINDVINKDLKSELEEKLAVGSIIYLLTSIPGENITLTTTEFNPNYLQIIPYEDVEWLLVESTSETTLNITMEEPQGTTKYATINFYKGADYASGIVYCIPIP